VDQLPAVAFTAFTDAWLRAMEMETGIAQCTTGMGMNFEFDI